MNIQNIMYLNCGEQMHSFAIFIFYVYITNSQCDQLPDVLIAQLVEHCTSIAEVMGSYPAQA